MKIDSKRIKNFFPDDAGDTIFYVHFICKNARIKIEQKKQIWLVSKDTLREFVINNKKIF